MVDLQCKFGAGKYGSERKKLPLNFAHRGFRSKYPENTMLAFEKAVEAGCDGIEFDVHLTSDNRIVIIHDEELERTTRQKGLVKDFTLPQLRTLNAAAFFSGGINEKIPTLEEYFDFVKDKNIISNIELKTGIFEYRGIENAVYSLIKKYGLQDSCIVSSFNHESILRMKELDKNICCGFLADSWEINPAPYLKAYGIECYHPPAYRLTKEFVGAMQEQGIRVNAWYGSIQTDYGKAIETGLDALITDYPDKAAEILRKSAGAEN